VLLARPWLDQIALPFIADWVLPTLRVSEWVLASGGDVARLASLAGVEIRPSDGLRLRVEALFAAAAAEAETRADWHATLFGTCANEAARLRVEFARLEAARTVLRARLGFWSWAQRWRAPRVALTPVPPDALEAAIEARLADPVAAFPCDSDPLRASGAILGEGTRTFWIESAAGARARVVAPADPRGTILVLHGLGVEPDEFLIGRAELEVLIARGFRVLLLEGPFHGWRRKPGFYVGEPVLADAPRGALDYFERHVAELGNFTRWARAFDDGPIGWIGTSLGAFTAAIGASAAHGWPAAARPDGVLLITVGSAVYAPEILDGELCRRLGVMPALERAGWTRQAIIRLAPLTGPVLPPVCGAERVHLLLGSYDAVTPLASGFELAARWNVPAANIELQRRGHYTIPIGLERNPAPILRFAASLGR
jgi:hypothetical protein